MKQIMSIAACVTLLMLLSVPAQATGNDSRLHLGFFAGATQNEITGIPQMLVPEDFFSGYEFEQRKRLGFTGGVFLNYRPSPLFAVQPELGFSMKHGEVGYSDIDGFKYDLVFRYNYLNAGVGFKLYPWRHLFLSVTPQVGFNLNPGNLRYWSNDQDRFGPDLQTQQLLRGVIKGRTNVTLSFGLGYQFWNRFYVDVRYYLGLSDMIETLHNNFGFAETVNLSNGFQVTLGFAIPMR